MPRTPAGSSPDGSFFGLRVALVSVSDLDRSAAFYQELLGIEVRLREAEMVAMGGETASSPALFLREATRRAVHPGRETLGVRALGFEVGSVKELERIEQTLDRHGIPHERLKLDEPAGFEFVRGHDPDRNALVFTASPPGQDLTAEHYGQALNFLYVVDN